MIYFKFKELKKILGEYLGQGIILDLIQNNKTHREKELLGELCVNLKNAIRILRAIEKLNKGK
ncbi:MAG: hypothetical protein DRI98_11860 [Bacteroidetes bacterium]|nr:MAG: hypothetical protein DRI98_11860 [Bacteroidota bacterium]